MKLSACTFIGNANKYEYPIVESVNSLLPYVDEYVINMKQDSEDDTDKLIFDNFSHDSKVKTFKSIWEGKDQGMTFFRNQTNLAIDACSGDWIFYLQGDEAIHESDAVKIRLVIDDADKNECDAIMFNFLHFEGDYDHTKLTYSQGADAYEQEIRLIKNNGKIRSVGDAMSFGGVKKIYKSDMNIYHYGYVRSPKVMLAKKLELKDYYFSDPAFTEDQKVIENGKIRSNGDEYKFSRSRNDFTGSHPSSMIDTIKKFKDR